MRFTAPRGPTWLAPSLVAGMCALVQAPAIVAPAAAVGESCDLRGWQVTARITLHDFTDRDYTAVRDETFDLASSEGCSYTYAGSVTSTFYSPCNPTDPGQGAASVSVSGSGSGTARALTFNPGDGIWPYDYEGIDETQPWTAIQVYDAQPGSFNLTGTYTDCSGGFGDEVQAGAFGGAYLYVPGTLATLDAAAVGTEHSVHYRLPDSSPDDATSESTADYVVTYRKVSAATLDPEPVVTEAGTSGDLGVVCGNASFGWRQVTLSKTSVAKGESVCVFLVGNAIAKSLLNVAKEQGVTIGQAFSATLLRRTSPEAGRDVAIWAEKWLAKKLAMRAIARAIGANPTPFAPIVTIGKVVALAAVPLAVGFVVGQIRNNDACVQVIVDVDDTRLKSDWSMVYAHSSDKRLTNARVYRKERLRLRPDRAVRVPLGMKCQSSGRVTVMQGTDAMTAERTQLFRMP